MNTPYVFKKCNKCGKLLVVNTDNFYKIKGGKYNLFSCCKPCTSKRYKEKQGKERTTRTPNEIIIHEDYAEMLLYNNKSVEVARTIIDIEDIEKVKKYKWHLDNKGYVETRVSKKGINLHRFILDYDGPLLVDHITGNKLDNRKSNLRIVTNSQNNMNTGLRSNNTSGKTGVHFNKEKNKWTANIKINGKSIFLGYYKEFEEAVKAREEGEIKYFGEYRRK